MQNYLQKNSSKNRIAKRVLMLMFTILVLVLICLIYGKLCVSDEGEKNNAGYAGKLYTMFSDLSSETFAQVSENDAEMNNQTLENANYVQNEEKNTSRGVECEYVHVLQKDSTVETMELEEYVKGCLLGEMPISFEPQALMAQSIAIRTFTVRQSTFGKSKHKNADVCTDSACCQSFLSPADKKISEGNMKKLCDAVSATRGIIMVYNGEPIEAVYHASSGEYTLSSEDVWGGRVEYLRSVPSPEGEAQLASTLYGHRVGMSQQGANLLAKEGKRFTEILGYYYTGIGFDFLA